jgi:hypothetical protein
MNLATFGLDHADEVAQRRRTGLDDSGCDITQENVGADADLDIL